MQDIINIISNKILTPQGIGIFFVIKIFKKENKL